MERLLISSFLCFLAVNVTAQSGADLQHYQQLYHGADAVFIKNDRSVNVSLDKGALSIYQDDYEDLMLLGNNVNKYSESSVGYSSLIDLVYLDAKTMVPEKNKYRTEEAKDIVTQQSLAGSIFYDDYKEKKIYFSGLEPGARRIVSSREQVKMPQLLPPFFFQSYAPCEKSTYEISVPDNVNIEYHLFNVPENDVHFSMEQKKDEKIYKWEYQNVAGISFIDDDAPGIGYFMPHIVVRVTNFTADGKANPILGSADDLYKWYYGFIRNVNQSYSAQLKQLVDSITLTARSDEEKARQIFYWVQDRIRYVAFEEGMAGFIPRAADSVCDKRYGDCKDMAGLLTRMLREAGLNAYPAWVGTRDIPYTYEQLPSPLVDNHMISALQLNGKYFFLDATSKHLGLQYPSSFIQGKEALIAIDSSKYKIERVNEVEAEQNAVTDSFRLAIDQRVLNGTGVKHLVGYPQQNFAYFLSDLSSTNFKKGLEARLAVGNNKYLLDTFKIVNRDERDKDLIVNSKFHIADYVQQAGDEIYVNMNLDRPYYNDLLDTATRKLDREIDYKSLTRQHYEIEIPAGYEVEYLPSSSSFRNDSFNYEIKYTQSQGKVMLDKTITVNCLLLARKDFPDWNNLVHQLSKAYNEAIILKKKA